METHIFGDQKIKGQGHYRLKTVLALSLAAYVRQAAAMPPSHKPC